MAQKISYEVSLALILLSSIFVVGDIYIIITIILLLLLLQGIFYFKILTLEVNDECCLFLEVLKDHAYFWFTKPIFSVKSLKSFNVNTFIFLLCLFLCGTWVFTSSRKHSLITLLRLVFMVLILFVIIYFCLCTFNYELRFFMFFLVFSVFEGSLVLLF